MRAVVIGAGFSGLAASLRLARAGVRVTVVDQLDGPGGKAVGWQGVPTGPTVLTLPDVPREIFAQMGATAPRFDPVHPTTRYTFADGRRFDPHVDEEVTLRQLHGQERADYSRLLRVARVMYEDAEPTFLRGAPPTWTRLATYAARAGVRARPWLPLHRLVQSGAHLTPFFLRFATYMGANPFKAPAVLHNIAWVELGLGVFHVNGGMKALADAMEALARRHGVEFRYGCPVREVITERSTVTSVRTEAGTLDADIVVSAADRHFTLQWLKRPIPTRPLGVSGFALLMRLREPFPTRHYIFFPADYAAEWKDIDAGRPPGDPTLYVHLDGNAAFLLVNVPSGPLDDTEGYARHVQSLLARRMPLPVAEQRVCAPQDFAVTSYLGALYGRAPHGLMGTLRDGWNVPGLQNLTQVGGTVHPGGGVPLSMLGGWNGAAHALERAGVTEPMRAPKVAHA